MKLICCTVCQDILSLGNLIKHCGCGESSGRYVGKLHAEFSGPCIPIGIANIAFVDAIRCPTATDMTAFVIQKRCDTMQRIGPEPPELAEYLSRMPSTTRYLTFCKDCREVSSARCTHPWQRKVTFDGPSFREAMMNQPEHDWGKDFCIRVENAPLNQ